MKDKFYNICSKVLESLKRGFEVNSYGLCVIFLPIIIGYGLCELSLNGFEWKTFVSMLALCILEVLEILLLGDELKNYFVEKSKIKNITVCYYANDGKQYIVTLKKDTSTTSVRDVINVLPYAVCDKTKVKALIFSSEVDDKFMNVPISDYNEENYITLRFYEEDIYKRIFCEDDVEWL